MVEKNQKGLLIVVSGPSGVGKDTICNEVTRNNKNIWLSISMTTREKRVGEIDGINYYFAKKKDFIHKIKENGFLEYAEYNGQFYGTPKDKIDDYLNRNIDVILIIDVQGALQIKRDLPDSVLIFLLPPSMEELEQRLTGRKSETRDQIINRLKIASKEISNSKQYDYLVVANSVKDGATSIETIIKSEKMKSTRNQINKKPYQIS